MHTKKRPHWAELPAGPQTPITSLIDNGPKTTHLRGWVRKALRKFEQGTQAEKYRSRRSKAWTRDKLVVALKAEPLIARSGPSAHEGEISHTTKRRNCRGNGGVQ